MRGTFLNKECPCSYADRRSGKVSGLIEARKREPGAWEASEAQEREPEKEMQHDKK
jgi:hypothetical protein